jgi:hypothetical protein
MDFYPADARFVATGPDLATQIVAEAWLPQLLREHGPERLHVYAEAHDGTLVKLHEHTQLVSKDDKFKYYRTAWLDVTTGMTLDVGWDI